MLYIPRQRTSRCQSNTATTSSEPGNLVTANATTNVMGNYTQLIAATNYTSYGITVILSNTAVAATSTRVLVDIAKGGAGSEQVVIPTLIGGNAGVTGSTEGTGHIYHFPIIIPAGTRIAARCQAFNASDTVNVDIKLHQYPRFGAWYGNRVTAYGANTSASTGTSISPGNGSYTTGTIIASTTNPVRYLQAGIDFYTGTNAATSRGLFEVLTGSTVLVKDLTWNESTTTEVIDFSIINFILSQMMFNLPIGNNLTVGLMRNVAAAAHGVMLYGVD